MTGLGSKTRLALTQTNGIALASLSKYGSSTNTSSKWMDQADKHSGIKFLRKYAPVYQPVKRRSIIKNIAHLPPSSPCEDDTTTLPKLTPNPSDTTPPPDDTTTPPHHPSRSMIHLLFLPILQRRTPHLPWLQPRLVWKLTSLHHHRLHTPNTRDRQTPTAPPPTPPPLPLGRSTS